jgi:predicted nucleic acid-binding protein
MATTSVSRLFVDTNVLIYATDPVSPWHPIALTSLQEARRNAAELCVSPQIIREYVAAATRAALTGGGSATAGILNNMHTFRTDFTVLDDTPRVLDQLAYLISTVAVAGKQVHDANIVATMLSHGVHHLLTHNTADFVRFGQLMTIVPLTGRTWP